MSSSWLRTKVAHCAGWRDRGAAGAPRPAAGVGAGERQVQALHADEVEEHRQLVAVLAAEEAALVGVGQVHLAEQDGVAGAAVEEGPQVAQVVVGVGHVDAGVGRRPR